MPESRPDRTQIEEEKTWLVGEWTSAHARWRTYDEWIEGRADIWGGRHSDRGQYRPSTPANVINHAVNVQLNFIPTIHRDPVRNAQESRDWADEVEDAARAIVLDSLLADVVIASQQINRHFLSLGYAILEGPVRDLEAAPMPEEPERMEGEDDEDFALRKAQYESSRKNWNPIRFYAPHPDEVLIDPMERDPSLAIKRLTLPADRLRKLTEYKAERMEGVKLFDMKGHKRKEPIRLLERWADDGWHTLMVEDNDVLFSEENIWGFLPFQHAYAGWGHRPSRNSSMSFARAMAVGVLEALIEHESAPGGVSAGSLRAAAQKASAHHEILMIRAYFPLGTTQDSAEMAGQVSRSKFFEGEPGDLWAVQFPEISRQLAEFGRDVDQDINLATLNPALAGFRQQGVSTVGQQAILSTAAQRQFGAIARQNEYMWTKAVSNMLRLADVMDEEYGVNGKMLRKKTIEHSYRVTVTFESIDAAIAAANKETGMREYQLGLKSRETYWEQDAQLTNASQERKRILRNRMEEIPAVLTAFAQQVAEEEGIGEEFAQAVAASAEGEPVISNFAPVRDGTGRVLTDPRDMLTPETENPAR